MRQVFQVAVVAFVAIPLSGCGIFGLTEEQREEVILESSESAGRRAEEIARKLLEKFQEAFEKRVSSLGLSPEIISSIETLFREKGDELAQLAGEKARETIAKELDDRLPEAAEEPSKLGGALSSLLVPIIMALGGVRRA